MVGSSSLTMSVSTRCREKLLSANFSCLVAMSVVETLCARSIDNCVAGLKTKNAPA